MSWSVSKMGKAAAVRVALAADFAKITCPEPEQTVKSDVAAAVDAALAVYPANVVVRVEAAGSQYKPSPDAGVVNTVSLKVEALHSFVE